MTAQHTVIDPLTTSVESAYAMFLKAYPTYQETILLDNLRRTEYGRLDEKGHIYLDYTGGGLYADSQLTAHFELLRHHTFGNPHSHNPTSMAMTERVEQVRKAVLDFFQASPEEYVVIFTPNASGALKLVGEAYPFTQDSRFALAADDHNSVNGIREFARARGASVAYAPLTMPDLRLDQPALFNILDQANPETNNLFAYPAQSNYSGVKHPLSLIEAARDRGWDVLLDCAAFAPTNRLDLSRWQPDFATFSFYKLFGYPTGVGALLARREALAKLQRPWFAGGTVRIVSVQAGRHFLAEDEAGFEDGTINYLSLPAVEIGLQHINAIGIETINTRVRCLTGWLLGQLTALRHDNGRSLIHIQGPVNLDDRGGTITMSFQDVAGTPISGQLVEQLAADGHISLRTGCFCNPGAGETTFQLPQSFMKQLFAADQKMHFVELVETVYAARGVDISAVRISLGVASNFADVHQFLQFATGFRNKQTSQLRSTQPSAAHTMRDAA